MAIVRLVGAATELAIAAVAHVGAVVHVVIETTVLLERGCWKERQEN